ncbi:hypothetical protein [Mycobacteroides abscessus]|uniref:hypothetical protein n=1 Tax=Mycobacteroides abscessus TaxID=36809 RepID=UPI0009A6804D|nr:hypothetical protein [Mycobacteroides abscessus]
MTGREHEKTSSKVFVNAAGGLIAAIAFAILTWAWHKWPDLMENARRYQEAYSGYSHFPTFLIALWIAILAPIAAIVLFAIFAVLAFISLMGFVDSRKPDSDDKDEFFTFNAGLILGVLTPFSGYVAFNGISEVWREAVFLWTK